MRVTAVGRGEVMWGVREDPDPAEGSAGWCGRGREGQLLRSAPEEAVALVLMLLQQPLSLRNRAYQPSLPLTNARN